MKDYLEKNHKDRIFEFVWVDKYEGLGASVGYSMLRAKNNLQCPFIFHACDTIVEGEIPIPDKNWIGGYVENWQTTALPIQNYDTCSVKDGKIIKLNERGVMGFDTIYLGLDGIFDYELYWKTFDSLYQDDPNNSKLHPIQVLNVMLGRGIKFQSVPYSVWLDTGTPTALEKTERFLSEHSSS